MIFLAGRDRHTQRSLLREIHARLSKQAGCETIQYQPSSRRPRTVIADVETAVFLGTAYEVENAHLEVRFWYPDDVDYEYYRLNWIEPARELMVGFHQDADHSDLGRCHLQLDFEEDTVDRQPAPFLDAHPLAVLEERLQQLPAVLDSLEWENGRPSLA